MKPKLQSSLIFERAYSAYLLLILLIVFSSCASQKKRHAKRNTKRAYYAGRPYTNNGASPKSSSPDAGLSAPARPSVGAEVSELSRREIREINESDDQVINVIQKARSYTGVPYAWGGTTRAGMDCSGLLYTTFQACGISIPRTSTDQSKSGSNVTLYDLRPGDFVFFAAQKGKPHKITHVGMVTEVLGKHNVQFIHASTKLGVVENNIYADYYRRIFVKARRLF